MIYDTLDIIPLKLFLRIRQTGEIHLLSNEKTPESDLKEIWEYLKEEYDTRIPDGNEKKLFDVSVRIETLKAKYNSIKIGISALRFDRDIDLENMIRSYRYKLTEQNFNQDLDNIDRESESILIKIARLEQKLPTYDKSDKTSTIDRVILGYCAITGLMYDTNVISPIQFDALKNIAEQKMKALEEVNSKIKNKNKRR